MTEAQRHRQYERLRARNDPRTTSYDLKSFWFNNEDMREIINAWKKDYTSWMHADSIVRYESLLRDHPQSAHQLLHSRYNTYLFQLFGSKVLTLKFIEMALFAVENQFQGRKLGKRLMGVVQDAARSRGAVAVLTYADFKAFSFFKRVGFSRQVTLPHLAWKGLIVHYEGAAVVESLLAAEGDAAPPPRPAFRVVGCTSWMPIEKP